MRRAALETADLAGRDDGARVPDCWIGEVTAAAFRLRREVI
jgi:hypothetical protein